MTNQLSSYFLLEPLWIDNEKDPTFLVGIV